MLSRKHYHNGNIEVPTDLHIQNVRPTFCIT